ncbi:hypothetical protein SLEP1_g33841 [Rubroshorea leprosula]|uniref:Uncharacterized protein n=1 Tax=Rubroshorea leprosula TaxID=152421 RepID=A0AAV5KHX4_9ROSI|nr:hypothetical protein SLEP1_g33841 [Rubroshorea leprosula]
MGACASVSKNMRDKEAEVPATEPIKEESAEGEHTTKEENKADGEQSLASLLDQVPAADEGEAELPSQAVAAEENKEEVAAVAAATEPEKIAVSEEEQTEEQKESN